MHGRILCLDSVKHSLVLSVGVVLAITVASILSTPVDADEQSKTYRPVPVTNAQPLQGADAILKQVMPDKSKETKVVPQSEELTALRESLKSFSKNAESMSSQQAAETWLGLADRYFSVGQKAPSYSMRSPFSFAEVVAALPPPDAWPALTQAIEARQPYQRKSVRDLSFLVLAHVLTGNDAQQQKAFTTLRTQVNAQGSDEPYSLSQMLPVLALALAKNSGDAKRILQATKAMPAEMQGMGTEVDWSARAMALRNRAGGASPVKQVPDLVTLQGSVKAQAELRQLLTTSRAELVIPLGDETMALAQKLALGLVPPMKTAQWSLAHSLHSLALFEAMERRFLPANAALTNPPKSSGKKRGKVATAKPVKGSASYQIARAYYVLGLIAARRSTEASSLALRLGRSGTPFQINPETLADMDKAGHAQALNDFLRNLLAKDPTLPYWGAYITAAARAGQADTMLAMVRNLAARNKDATRLTAIRQTLYQALLASDRVTEGVSVLRQLMNTPKTSLGKVPVSRLALATTLAKVGQVTGHPEWVTEGVKIVRASGGESASWMGHSGVASILLELGRDGEAEKELIKPLKMAMARASVVETDAGEDYMMEMGEQSGLTTLTSLAGIYHRRGRHQDVLDLLEKAPWWPTDDLSEIANSVDTTGTPLGYMAAAALAKTGRQAEALTILKTILHAHNGFDPAYRLLIDLEGEASLETLDGLFEEDRFEERPLIWKAQVLLTSNRLEEAEKVVRQAIAIDPSDGEQGKGSRMRAYAVLANIRSARGDKAQAALFNGAVKAIRVSENADDAYNAGLLVRGIRMYKQALTYFADAYCIQSRIAVQLAAQGRYDEAESHYRRAFELMPDSFGRMESHCFGCEGAFEGARATNMAEAVFRRLMVKSPNKPQLHYLMGYLRSSQGRYREAASNYRRAVQLDKDYINAWSKLLETGSYMELPKADREGAVLNLLRLDPSMRHATPDFSQVSDLKKLWVALKAANAKRKDVSSPSLLPLTASRPFAEKRAEGIKKMLEQYGMSQEEFDAYRLASETGGTGALGAIRFASAGKAIASNRAIAAIVQLLDYQKQLTLMKTFGV
jgi:tetratricopeptide (TPR) repeat protein